MQNRRAIVDVRGACGALGLLLLAATTWAEGQPSPASTKGFSIGTHASFGRRDADPVRLGGQLFDTEAGHRTGGGFSLAYGIDDGLTVYLNGDGGERDEHVLAHGDLGAQLLLRRGHRLRPHLDVALTGRKAEFEAGPQWLEGRGTGVSFGAGALYFPSSSIALDLTFLRTVGELDRYRDGARAGSLGTSWTTRANLGIRWYPGR